jgi:hypothetical protein
MADSLRCVLVASIVALVLPAAAWAESISYVEGGNVYISTTDGARRVPITSNGSADSPYTLAGHADSGRTIAAFGPVSSRTWFIFNPDGTSTGEGPNLVPMKHCGNPSVGPVNPRIEPAGDLVAYNYYCNYGFSNNFAISTRLVVDNPKYYTAGPNTPDIGSDWYYPTWLGKRLVVGDTQKIFVQDENAGNPFSTNFTAWILPDPGEKLTRMEVSRAGGRAVLDYSLNDVAKIAIGTFSGTPPSTPDWAVPCTLDAATGAPTQGTLSPDGTKLAWIDNDGVKIAQVDLGQPGCVAAGSVRTLSAGGSQPRFSAYTIPEPAPPPADPGTGTGGGQTLPAGGGTQQPTGGGTTAKPVLGVTIPAAAKLAALIKGLVVSFDVNQPGIVEAALTMPAKQAKKLGVARVAAANVRLGFARKVVTAAGKGKLTVKLTKKAKKRARRLKGKTVTLRTTFKPKTGTPVVSVKKVRVR